MRDNDDREYPYNYPSRRQLHSVKKKSGRGIGKMIFILFIAFLLACGVGAAVHMLFSDNDETDHAAQGIMTSKDKMTVMIMGVDEREDDVGRSDTLMLATIDPKKNQTALLSIPRDTRVEIPGRNSFDKINAAYAYGGHKLTRKTVENFLGIRVNNYILINLKSFNKIIDAIGGVDIDVEKRMYYEDPWDDNGGLVIDLYPGKQHMDGETAITYVRYRDEEGDIGRIARQQKFMAAIMDKVTSPAIIPRIPEIIAQVFNSVETNMSIKQLIEFASALRDSRANGLKTAMVPGDPVYIDDISYWIPDITELRTTMANILGVRMSQSAINAMERDSYKYSKLPDNARKANVTDNMKRLTKGSKQNTKDNNPTEYKSKSKASTSRTIDIDEEDERDIRTKRSYSREDERDTNRRSSSERDRYDRDYTVPSPGRSYSTAGSKTAN